MAGGGGRHRSQGRGDSEWHLPHFFGSNELLGQLRQMWKGSPETCEFALKQMPASSASRSRRWAGEGSPNLPLPGAAADALGQKHLRLLQLRLPDAACLWLN